MDSFQILREIGDALSSTLEPEEMFRLALDKCIKFTRSDTGSIITINRESRILEIRYQVGLGSGAEERVKLKIGEGVTGMAAKDKKPLLVNDVEKSEIYVAVNPAIKSEIAVPMIHKNRLLGVISVDSKRRENYRKEDLELLGIVANQIAQALHNIDMYQEVKRRVFHDELLLEIHRVLASSLDLMDTFEDVFGALRKSAIFEKGALILWDEATQALTMKSWFGYSRAQAEKASYKVDEGVVGKVFSTGKTEAIRDVHQHPTFLDKTEARRGEKRQIAFFAVPLVMGQRSLGVMIFDHVFRDVEDFQHAAHFLEMLETQISKSLQIHVLAQKEKKRLVEENAALKTFFTESDRFGDIVGRSDRMRQLYAQIRAVSGSDSTVLVTGESGTGKELVAAAIHYNSPRRERPFVAINCAAIPENLLESELFGYKKGAFTGAIADKAGKFRLADGGTLFLDEIGELPTGLQSKLLRVLQESVVDPVGSGKTEPIDVRVIAATNKVLLDEIRAKTFREDLYYRLSIIPIHLPPLRERREDIPLLVEHFLAQYRVRFEKPSLRLTEHALRQLLGHPWSGNVRELRNVLERSVIFAESELIDRVHFDESRGAAAEVTVVEATGAPLSTGELLRRRASESLAHSGDFDLQKVHDVVDRVMLDACLRVHKGVHQQAAKALGISRETLRKRVRELEIDIYHP